MQALVRALAAPLLMYSSLSVCLRTAAGRQARLEGPWAHRGDLLKSEAVDAKSLFFSVTLLLFKCIKTNETTAQVSLNESQEGGP